MPRRPCPVPVLVGFEGCPSFSQNCSPPVVLTVDGGGSQFPLLILCRLLVSHPLPAWGLRTGPLGDRVFTHPLSIGLPPPASIFRFPLGFRPPGGPSCLAKLLCEPKQVFCLSSQESFYSPCQVTMLLFLYAKLKVENEVDGERNPYFGKEL